MNNFYTELYCFTLQDRHPSLKSTSSDSPEVQPIITSEVKKTLKEMKNKARGIDNLRSDVMILREEKSVKQIIKKKIFKTKKIPVEWKVIIVVLHKKGDTKSIKNYRPSTFPYVQTVHTDITEKNGKGS